MGHCGSVGLTPGLAQWIKGSSVARLSGLVTAVARIHSLAGEPPYAVGVAIKKKLEFPYDPAIPLFGIYPKELRVGSQRDSCTPMFIAALFSIAKR